MQDLPVRKSNRLKNYDYSQNGAYFITFCVKDKHEMLGKIDVGAIRNRPGMDNRQKMDKHLQMVLSEYGKIVELSIEQIPNYSNTYVDKFIIMPNHVHMILIIKNNYNEKTHGRLRIAPTVDISVTIQQLKRRVSKEIGFSLWQKSFHDHIIRDEEDYQNHWQYIDENPLKWAEDEYYK